MENLNRKISGKFISGFQMPDKYRMLWIKLNAERIQYAQKKLNNIDEPLGDIDTLYSCMYVSKTQLEYDEKNCGEPRFSLEELSTLLPEELFRLAEKRGTSKLFMLFNDESFDITDLSKL